MSSSSRGELRGFLPTERRATALPMTRTIVAFLGLALLSWFHTACAGGDQPTEPEPGVGRLRGQVIPVGPDTPSPLRLRVSSTVDTLTREISTDTRFSMNFDPEDSVEQVVILIEEVGDSTSRFHPAYFPLPMEAAPEFIDILLIPTTWTVQKGVYAGETVDISVNAALTAPPRAQPGYLWSRIGASSFRANFAVWEEEDRPIPVVFTNHQAETNPIASEDSLRFWEELEEMERVFGRDLFVPRSAAEIGWGSEGKPLYQNGTILVHIDSDVPYGGLFRSAPESWEWPTTETSPWDTPPPSRFNAVGGPIEAGFNRYSQDTFRDLDHSFAGYTIRHEMMHAMGLGHTCFIHSIMAYGCGDASLSVTPTAHDVAYWELRQGIHQLSKDYNTRFSWLPALFGERAQTFGLDPVPSLEDWRQAF